MIRADPAVAQQFLHAVYPDIPGHLALFALPARRSWFLRDHAQAAKTAADWASRENLYLGVGCMAERPDTGRGTEALVTAIPGVWADIDVQGAAHKAANLPPTTEDALRILEGVHLPPSLIVHSGHGLQAWWLFKEPWVFESERDRTAAKSLAVRWQTLLRREAARYKWTVDGTADLTRVLRIPGTINRKIADAPKLVTFTDSGRRYAESEILELVEHIPEAEIEQTRRRTTSVHTGPPAQLLPILEGCSWMRHCRDDAAALQEPEWYQMLTVVGRCDEAEHWAHKLSCAHRGYSAVETHAKLVQATDRAPGPVTCRHVETTFGETRFCLSCAHHGRITSPIQLGRAPEPPPESPEIDWEPGLCMERPPVDPERGNVMRVVDLPSVFDVSRAETPYLIPLYLPESSILILSGESGHGKSTVASLMAGAVAEGTWFAGQEAQQREVLLLDRDNPAHVLSERLTRIGVTSPNIRVWGQWCREEAPDPAAAPILEYVRDTNPKPLVIVDSLLDFLEGDENESKIVRMMFGRLRILTGAGATVILVHHTGKAESSSEYRGSSAIKGSCDAAFKVSDLSPAAGLLTRIQLKAWKMRVRINPHIILDWDEYERSFTWRPPRGAESNTDVVRELLSMYPGSPIDTLCKLGMDRGMTRSAVRSTLENGITGGWISTERTEGRGNRAIKHYLIEDAQ